ncbi:VCBS domain-containing protein, partial [Crateriforma spongiae]|uniref:VCBS domain-containing protein n=1 Tax=Crateriforma spongiae TaxID=2724528 RepID=UPI001448553A
MSNSEIDFLGENDQLVLTYTVAIDDQNGGTDTQDVVITVNGTNDAPIIDSPAQAATVTESADTNPDADPAVEAGTISFDDVDLSDAHVASHDGGTVTTVTLANGLTLTPAQETAILAAFSIDPSVA